MRWANSAGEEVDPARASRYFYNLAYASYRLGDAAKARAFLQKAGPTPPTRKRPPNWTGFSRH
jgi:hypothetical protein